MLTSSTYGLDWPWVIGPKGRRYRLYLSKVGGRTVGKPPSYFDCITNFIQISGYLWLNLGDLEE